MKKRIMSALFLIFIAIPIIIAGEKTFALSIGIIGVFALKEIIDLKRAHGKIPSTMTLIFILSLLCIIYLTPFDKELGRISYALLSILFFVYFLPTLFYSSKNIYKTKDAYYFFGVTLFLGLACHSIIMVRIQGLFDFLYMALIPILTDTFALFFGMFCGKHKLAPVISPKKTWEGSIFGGLLATIICSIFYFFLVRGMNVICLFFMTFALSIIGQLGDLFFSKMKRENRIKDFSNLIPGHGGILDRFDSMIFVALAFVFLGFYL